MPGETLIPTSQAYWTVNLSPNGDVHVTRWELATACCRDAQTLMCAFHQAYFTNAVADGVWYAFEYDAVKAACTKARAVVEQKVNELIAAHTSHRQLAARLAQYEQIITDMTDLDRLAKEAQAHATEC